ncbi:hypothetical protein GCM10027343_26830 [Noviherbaspirillum agri]
MEFLPLLVFIAVVAYFMTKHRNKSSVSITHLPERFIVLDLETTGLDSGKHEIIEIAAIRVNRDSTQHETFQALVKPTKKIPKRIVDLTGITEEMLEQDGRALQEVMKAFSAFVGDLRLVSFNAEFDMGFLNAATAQCGMAPFGNSVTCALKMARRAWPGRKSYRLTDIARDGNLDLKNSHRALADCERALMVYGAAASKLESIA